MDDPIFKSKYRKYKYKVKLWEKDFQRIHGRIPSKLDIREAPTRIRDAYKMYFKLKSTFLEDTLSQVFDEDGFDLSQDSSQLIDSNLSSSSLGGANSMENISLPTFLSTNYNLITSPVSSTVNQSTSSIDDSQIEMTDTSISTGPTTSSFSNLNEINSLALTNLKNIDSNHVIKEFEAEHEEPINQFAWGSELNKKMTTTKTIKKDSKISKQIGQQITEKLFKNNANFTKRNPRKPLAKNDSQNSLNLSQKSSLGRSLPDLETILLEKAAKQQALEDKSKIVNTKLLRSQSQLCTVDMGWLSRRSGGGAGDNDETPPMTPKDSASSQSQQSRRFGISNLNILNPINRSISVPSLDKNEETYSQNTYDNVDDDDYDEVIENSEDESTLEKVRSVRHILKKRKVLVNKEEEKEINTSTDSPIIELNNVEVKTVTNVEEVNENNAVKNQTNKSKKIIKKNLPTKSKKTVTKKLPKAKKETKQTEITPRRRSTRTAVTQRNVEYTNRNTMDDMASDQDEPDIYATDSDSDFNIENQNSRGPPLNITNSSNDDDDDDDDGKDENEPAKAEKEVKKTIKTKKIIKPKQTKQKNIEIQRKNTDNDHENMDEEMMDEYLLEFGLNKLQNTPRIDLVELQKNSQVFDDFVNEIVLPTSKIDAVGTSTTNSLTNINLPLSKRDKDRKKLEEKIASGKLNENFVRIDIQHKKFVRGKKTMTFSKYKKSKWRKDKAAAALAGPEMDMRGCDGGFLVCFQCGQQGHMAEKCKIQSDKLLPLSADAEKSDFLTLDEVEKISQNQAKIAHANKPNTLPVTANSNWKLNNETPNIDDTTDAIEVSIIKPISSEIIELDKPKTFIGHKIPEEFLKKAGLFDVNVGNSDGCQPLYDLNEDGNVIDTPTEVYDALKMFGHQQFRKNQDKAIMRVLSGMSSLVTLSTGSGKSLCYQLPAYLYRKHYKNCITLVISPLVSLMEDQIHDVPSFLNAQCLHMSQTKVVRERTMELIKAGAVDVLLISPEAVVSGEKSTGFGSILRSLPPIAFVCIDEAHCMSQWSHNFRPSYLMICRVLKEKLKVRCVLGLTATATIQTRESIVEHLQIPDGLKGVVSDIPLPDNLQLTISKDENRDVALVRLLKEEKFQKFQSIIIYCTRRDECERVAKYIRTCFQEEELQLAKESALNPENKSRKRKRIKRFVEFYHAGMVASRRKKIQNEFMRGDLKIVVATIAFGMGINKCDIRAVIHFNMPMTFESYVQEVGRAGRDGNQSNCHLFLESNGKDLVELRRHIYGNSIDRHVIRKLLRKVFVPCACGQAIKKHEYQDEIDAVQSLNWTDNLTDDTNFNKMINQQQQQQQQQTNNVTSYKRQCSGHEVCFSIDKTIQELDIPEENIATLLCYLELHEKRYIQVLSKAYSHCKIMSYDGPKSIKKAAQNCPPLAMAIALDLKNGISHNESTFIEFNVVGIASSIGWDSGVVKYQLKNLEWTNINGLPKRSTLSVEFSDLGFRVCSPGDLSDEELDTTLDLLHSRVVNQEKTQLIQLQNVFTGLSSVAFSSHFGAFSNDELSQKRSEELKILIRLYFDSTEIDYTDFEIDQTTDTTNNDNELPDQQIIADIRTMICQYPENNFTGRTLARIFHGVSSPVYPALVWSRCKYWRMHTKIDFNRIVRLANAEIVYMRT